MEPRRPENLPKYAEVCLQALADRGLGNRISLGGDFGLMHYFEYRSTFDVDAWWQPATIPEEQGEVVTVLKETLQEFGQVRV